jgi:hypothetical protein
MSFHSCMRARCAYLAIHTMSHQADVVCWPAKPRAHHENSKPSCNGVRRPGRTGLRQIQIAGWRSRSASILPSRSALGHTTLPTHLTAIRQPLEQDPHLQRQRSGVRWRLTQRLFCSAQREVALATGFVHPRLPQPDLRVLRVLHVGVGVSGDPFLISMCRCGEPGAHQYAATSVVRVGVCRIQSKRSSIRVRSFSVSVEPIKGAAQLEPGACIDRIELCTPLIRIDRPRRVDPAQAGRPPALCTR